MNYQMIQHNFRPFYSNGVFEKWVLDRVLHFDGQNLLLNDHNKPVLNLKTNKRYKKPPHIYMPVFWYAHKAFYEF